MKYLFTLSSCLLVSLVVSVGVSHAFDFEQASRGRNLFRWIFFEMRRTESLQHRTALMNRLWEEKTLAIKEFIAGRATVHEVIERFQEAEELLEDGSNGMVASYHRPHTQEQIHRQLIGWMEDELKDDPEQARQVIRRLKEGLAQERFPDRRVR